MMRKWLGVLETGLDPLPPYLSPSTPIPLAYWKTSVCGTVRFLFYFSNREGTIEPAQINFRYSLQDDKWVPGRAGHVWGPDQLDPIAAPDSTAYSGYYAISGPDASSYDDDPTPRIPAIIWSGRHAPDVAEIWLVQGTRTQRNPADGLYGVWTVCSERFEPFRVEAHDSSGRLVGYLDEPLSKWRR
jgi:hypothetical protein